MSRKPRVPSLRRHKPSSQGVVTLDGMDFYLGRWPEDLSKPPPDVQGEYDRLIAEWLANGRRLPAAPGRQDQGLTVDEIILAFWRWAEGHYRREDGTPTTELENYRYSLRPLRQLYGGLPAVEFSPLKLKAIRQKMVESGWARGLINQRAGRVVRVFKWAVSEELIPEGVYRALKTVRGLERGRCPAKESEPVVPVSDEVVDRTLPHLLPPVRAMIQVQRLTGARPGEVCAMRAGGLDTGGPVWLYRPPHHKTRHKGKRRVIAIGPKAQEIIRSWMRVTCPVCGSTDLPGRLAWRSGLCGPCADRTDEESIAGPWPKVEPPGDYYLFSPAEGMRWFREEQRRNRKSKIQPSQVWRKKRKPKKRPGERYTSRSYAGAVAKAVRTANTALACAPCKGKEPEARCMGCKTAAVPHWHPHQLRHAYATEVRRRFGLEGAQVALGHSQAQVTEIYAERDLSLAVRVAGEIG